MMMPIPHILHVYRYTALTSPLYIIGVWDCQLSAWGPWDQVVEVAGILGAPTVPVLFKGEAGLGLPGICLEFLYAQSLVYSSPAH